jgi:hypothetical protein
MTEVMHYFIICYLVLATARIHYNTERIRNCLENPSDV